MELNSVGKIFWTISAYSPMFLALILKIYLMPTPIVDDINCYLLIAVVIILASIVILYFILAHAKQTNPKSRQCEVIHSSNSEYALFVITYLIPFTTIDFAFENFIPTTLLFMFILYLYMNSPLFGINPILNFKYNLYDATYQEENIIIISEHKLKSKIYHDIKLIKVWDNVYINKNKIED